MRKLKRNETRTVTEGISPSAIGRSKEICDWAIDYIKDTLPEYEGRSVYGSDLGYEITLGPNDDGIYENDSWGFISKHINDARDELSFHLLSKFTRVVMLGSQGSMARL